MVYVALLRGINVGGKNKVGMKELKAAFEEAGMTSVRTYINSGNVIFSSGIRGRARLGALLEEAIAQFGSSDSGATLGDILGSALRRAGEKPPEK